MTRDAGLRGRNVRSRHTKAHYKERGSGNPLPLEGSTCSELLLLLHDNAAGVAGLEVAACSMARLCRGSAAGRYDIADEFFAVDIVELKTAGLYPCSRLG